MEHQSNNNQHSEKTSNDDSFEIFKPKILMILDKRKEKKKRAYIGTIHNFIAQADITNINKNAIKDFATQVLAQKLVIQKNASQGNEQYHKT